MLKKFYNALLILVCLTVPFSLFADQQLSEKQSLQNIVNNYLTGIGKQERISAVGVSVSKGNKIQNFYVGNVGFPPFTTPLTQNDLFEMGSITKSFTAVMILQLEGEGKLSINDKIGRWFPQYSQWKNVTIKQLLDMTSGIPSYTKNPKFQEKIYRDIRTEVSDSELLSYADPNKPLNSNTGFDYSNTNYILAGMIIEAITHDTFADQLQKRILNPLGLHNTFYVAGKNWKTVRKEIMPRMVHGYYYDSDTKKLVDITDSNLSWAGPAGAMIATTQDSVRWVQALYSGAVFAKAYREKALKELETLVSMKTGKPIDKATPNDSKGFGLGIGSYYDSKTGTRFWVYEGSGMGFRMMYIFNPQNHIIVASALNNKAGEGDASGANGDHILQLDMELYNKLK